MDAELKIKFPEKFGSDDEVLRLEGERKRRKTEIIPDALKFLIGRVHIIETAVQNFHFQARKIEEDGTQSLFLRMMTQRAIFQEEAILIREGATPRISSGSESSEEEDFSLEMLAEKVEKTVLLMLETEKVIIGLEHSLGIEMHERIKYPRFSKSDGPETENEAIIDLQNSQTLEESVKGVEGTIDLFHSRMKLITLRFNLQLVKQWEEKVFDENEALQLLESSIKIVEGQQIYEKEKSGFVNFHFPEVDMQSISTQLMGAVSCESVKKKHKSCNQDRYFHFSLPNLSFYLVCDGHGFQGEKVADAICQKLPPIFEQTFGKMKEATFAEVVNAIRQGFQQLDQELTCFTKAGSTLTCAIQTSIGLFFANIGDSRAVLDIEGKALQCTADQTTKEHVFAQLVKKRGVEIGYWKEEKNGPLRVFPSMLMLTSDFGNHAFQMEGVKHLTCIPEITFFSNELIKPGNSFLIIASDGLWSYGNSNQVVAAFRKRLENGQNLQIIAKELAAACYHAGGRKFQDDTTIVIVRF